MPVRNCLREMLLLLLLCAGARADDSGSLGWTFGGPGADEGTCVWQTSDGGFIVTGTNASGDSGRPSLWLLKVTAGGKREWSHLFPLGEYYSGECLLVGDDGGFTVVGVTLTAAPDNFDVRLLHTNRQGKQLWDRRFGGDGWDWSNFVSPSGDGGYIITGWTDSGGAAGGDLWLIKTDKDGVREWSRSYGGFDHEEGFCVQATNDGGFIATGITATYSISEEDLWLIKTDSAGQLQWTRTYGGAGFDEGRYVEQTRDGGYIVVGSNSSRGAGETDVWLIKLTAQGEMSWSRVFGGRRRDWGHAVHQTSDGGYVIVGSTLSFGAGGSDVWLIRTDAQGIKLWDRTYGGQDLDFGNAVQPTADGGFVIAGKTHSFGAGGSDLWLIKTDSFGIVQPAREPAGQ